MSHRLILQVLLLVLSPQVTLSHRPKDSDLIKKASESANKQYKETSGRDCKIELDGSLPDDSAGGVVGSTLGGKIRVDNTLEERLRILREKVSYIFWILRTVLIEQMLPELRGALFGKEKSNVSLLHAASINIILC